MFFGMCNSLATFQSMMDSIFIKEIEEGVTIVYMDDILIYATTPELLEKYTKRVLQKLCDHDLFLKAKKCEFNKMKMEYLGLVVEEGFPQIQSKSKDLLIGSYPPVLKMFSPSWALEIFTRSLSQDF